MCVAKGISEYSLNATEVNISFINIIIWSFAVQISQYISDIWKGIFWLLNGLNYGGWSFMEDMDGARNKKTPPPTAGQKLQFLRLRCLNFLHVI
jgi:hypothetical protein